MMHRINLNTIAVAFLQATALGSARSLWSTQPATYAPQSSDETILKTTYPVGNGKLGAMPFGPPGSEKLALNVDSLWSGGPFESSTYTGGNPPSSKAGALPGIRDFIFKRGSGNVTALYGSGDHYGSYRALGNISIAIGHGTLYNDYNRTLDLDRGLYTTTYMVDSVKYTTNLFCSYPAQACFFNIASTGTVPKTTVKFEDLLVDTILAKSSCSNEFAGLSGTTRAGPPAGMRYEARAKGGNGATTSCSDDGTLTITPSGGSNSLTIVFSANTNYDQKKGNAQNNYSFKGEDPGPGVEAAVLKAAKTTYEDMLSQHVSDYTELFGTFTLNLPDPNGSVKKDTASIISQYSVDGKGDPFVEGLLFDYARYLLIASSRDNSLPANLQGRWAEQLSPAWSADYHANINLQMNYWAADQTGLTKTQPALWNYMQDTWVPRGIETAKLLYNASGWVTHHEMNIFGHTAMKDEAIWANYPASAAWMMQHVWDNFEYSRDVSWLKTQGYPLLKGVAKFWLSQLQHDAFFKDGTLVVNPCNSPEHGPTTFGCAHFQQAIHQVFEAVLASGEFVSETDTVFKRDVASKLASLDKGLHFTTWGGIKEWKVPDSYGFDTKNTHRHLSHLVGWYPGYSISSFQGGYTNSTIQKAVAETLKSRGPGNAADANSGWEKVWRAACWARLNNTAEAYYELRYAIDMNFASNGLSMYNALSAPFQIDANFGLAGAMLSMLVVDMPQKHGETGDRTVVLGPAIPAAWGDGNVKGLRLRGGYSVDFAWDANGKVNKAKLVGSGKPLKLYNVDGKVL